MDAFEAGKGWVRTGVGRNLGRWIVLWVEWRVVGERKRKWIRLGRLLGERVDDQSMDRSRTIDNGDGISM